MKICLSEDTATMGIFGFSWSEKVAAFMGKQLKGTEIAKKLKSFWQAGGVNVSIVNNLYREYAALMASGKAPSSFTVQPDTSGNGGTFDQATIDLAGLLQKKTNIESPIVFEFLRSLFVLARDGKIPFAKWNPKGYQLSTELQKTFSTEQGIFDKAGSTGKYLRFFSVIAAVGVSAYLLSQIKEFK